MERVDQVLNECVFDETIKKDRATVTVNVAEEAMRRYAILYHENELEKVNP